MAPLSWSITAIPMCWGSSPLFLAMSSPSFARLSWMFKRPLSTKSNWQNISVLEKWSKHRLSFVNNKTMENMEKSFISIEVYRALRIPTHSWDWRWCWNLNGKYMLEQEVCTFTNRHYRKHIAQEEIVNNSLAIRKEDINFKSGGDGKDKRQKR